MLIAIMGESFANNNTVAESKKRMSQLAFVVDNWWIDPLLNKDRIVYIVAAFGIDSDIDDSEKFQFIFEKMKNLESKQNLVMNEISTLQKQIEDLSMAQMQSSMKHSH